jgi:hypothetical protein
MEIFPKLPRASKRLTEQVGVFAAGATPRPSGLMEWNFSAGLLLFVTPP